MLQELLQELLQGIQAMFFHVRVILLPNIVRALFVLLVGWIAAVLLRRITALAIRLAGVDVFAGRLGLTAVSREGRALYRPSRLAGMLVYGFVLLTSILIALDTLGLEAATVLLSSLVEILPRLAVGLVMLVVGALVLDFVTKLTEGITIPGLPGFNVWLPRIIRAALIVLILLAVLEQIGIAPGLVSMGFAALAGSTALTVVLALGLGGRSFAKNLLAGYSLRLHVQPGSAVQYPKPGRTDFHTGTIRKVGLTLTELQTEQGCKLVPNVELVGASLLVQAAAQDSPDAV